VRYNNDTARWNENNFDVNTQYSQGNKAPCFLTDLHDENGFTGIRIPNKSKEGPQNFDFRDPNGPEKSYLTGLHDTDVQNGMRIPNKSTGNENTYDVLKGDLYDVKFGKRTSATPRDDWEDPAWVHNKPNAGTGFGGVRIPNKSDHHKQTFDLREPPPEIHIRPVDEIKKWGANKTFEQYHISEHDGRCWLNGEYDKRAGMRIPNKTEGNYHTYEMPTADVNRTRKPQQDWLQGLHDEDLANGMRVPNKTAGNENSFDIRSAPPDEVSWDKQAFIDGSRHKQQPHKYYLDNEKFDFRTQQAESSTDRWINGSNDHTSGLKVPNKIGMRDQVETYDGWSQPYSRGLEVKRTDSDWLGEQLKVPNLEDGNTRNAGYDFRALSEPSSWLANGFDVNPSAGMAVPNRSGGNYQTFDFRG
jgi:hypothetical protein